MKELTILSLLLIGQMGLGKNVGLWKDARSHITDGMLKTIQDAGWETVILEGGDLADDTKLADLDVVFLPGGWNAYNFANFNARRNLVKYVAGGKGILACGFRSGYVRTGNRPLFPQVGVTYNRVNGPWVSGSGDSELAKAIDQPFCPGNWDHMCVKLGPLGKVFAVSDTDTVGAYGEVYGGRYLIFGAFIGMNNKTEPMQGTVRSVLLKSLEWLAAAPRLGDAEKTKQQAQADLDFMRREQLYDWTLNERGPDNSPGILPEIRNRLAIPLESRQYTLEYLGQYLAGGQQQECLSEAKALGKAVENLDRNYLKETSEITQSIAKMNLKELAAENPVLETTNVLAKLAAIPGQTEEEKKAITTSVKRGRSSSKNVAMCLHGDSISEKLMSTAELKKLVGHADNVIARLKPTVKAAKEEKAARERKQDLAALPKLINDCSAEDVLTRRAAVLELGRIGSPDGAETLIKLLGDADEKVRIDAILGLGWIQSREAVPALIKVAGGGDRFMRRRALQALGQIGDSRASDVLLANTDNEDYFTSENAIIALGWLKTKAAVPCLLKIATEFDRKDSRQRGLMMAAIRALGQIGDPAALPTLEKLAKEVDDYPLLRTNPIVNIYSTVQSLGIQGHAQLAIEAIRAGGRSEPGIKQADFLASKDKFYGLTGRFNALAGRSQAIYGNSLFEDDPTALIPYLWEAGLTGIHQAWGVQGNDGDPAEYFRLLRAASEFDLLWIDVMPADCNAFGGKQHYPEGSHQLGVDKTHADVVLSQYQDMPAFHGFWGEESYPDVKLTAAEFEKWLRDKHGTDFRKKLELTDSFELASLEWNTAKLTDKYPQPLRMEFLHCAGEKILGEWRETQEWLHGTRKGCAFTYSVADVLKYPGFTARVGTVIDANGPENYQCFGRYNGFVMEMHKDGEPRPVMSEYYNWYSPSPAHSARGFAQHLMHGECFYNFALPQIFRYAPVSYGMWTWDVSRWDNARSIFRKARTLREYLAVPDSAANVGLLCADLVPLVFEPKGYRTSLPPRWIQQQSALWTALNQCQIPTDVIWTETLTSGKLKRYRVLVLSDAKIITPEQAKLIRDWVNDGGTLIASGTTSLFDQWGRLCKNYLLADVFGVDYDGHAGVSDPGQIDTYCWKNGEPAFKAVSGLIPADFICHVYRDIKPVKSLKTYAIGDNADLYLPGIARGTTCEYDMPLGYDKVSSLSAEVLATFKNGDPALTVNEVGKGLCYFWTPIYPGLCHVTSEWEMQPNRLEFWPNVRELLGAMVTGGLEHHGATLPVEVSNVSKEVEVTVRQQPEHNRWMIHLLNYDPKVDLVRSPGLIVHPSSVGVKRMFYPDTGAEVVFETTGKGVQATMRDFEVHDMLVVEWK